MFDGAENVRRAKSRSEDIIITEECIKIPCLQATSMLSLTQQQLQDRENDIEKLQRADSDALEVSCC
jgi:hypothetical protein